MTRRLDSTIDVMADYPAEHCFAIDCLPNTPALDATTSDESRQQPEVLFGYADPHGQVPIWLDLEDAPKKKAVSTFADV